MYQFVTNGVSAVAGTVGGALMGEGYRQLATNVWLNANSTTAMQVGTKVIPANAISSLAATLIDAGVVTLMTSDPKLRVMWYLAALLAGATAGTLTEQFLGHKIIEKFGNVGGEIAIALTPSAVTESVASFLKLFNGTKTRMDNAEALMLGQAGAEEDEPLLEGGAPKKNRFCG